MWLTPAAATLWAMKGRPRDVAWSLQHDRVQLPLVLGLYPMTTEVILREARLPKAQPPPF